MGIWSSIVGGFLHHNLTAQAAKSTVHSPNATSKAAEIIDTLFTSEDERLDKQAVLARIALQSDSLQTLINLGELRHRSPFVAGWRPFVGWVCGLALAWHFMVLPCLQFLLAYLGHPAVEMPGFDLGALNTILFGLLGSGTLRTAEKAAGKA